MEPTICIIDDDLVSQFATVYCIEQAHQKCRTITCDNAAEGLEIFAARLQANEPLPDIVFLDLVMPNMNGWQFLDHLKDILNDSHMVDIYILSAFAKSKDREKAKLHPMIKGYFDKPLSKNALDKIFALKFQ